jgi:NAD(P)H-hydrate epimerase
MGEPVSRAPKKLPKRELDAHKGTFGSVLVIAGSEFMLGAAILCARGALRGGAGLVRVALPHALCAPLMTACPSAMTLDRADKTALRSALAAADAVVVGPGLGATAQTKRVVAEALKFAASPVVLDADSLNVLAPLSGPVLGAQPKVLLPHPGEAARLLSCTTEEVQRDRDGAAAQLSAQSGAIAVLKGAGTIVCEGTRRYRNTTGNPGMATGGSGDVLAGLVAALLAQGMEPFDAACLAVHVHGKAGDRVSKRLSQAGLIAEDLPIAIAEELA